MGGRARWEVAEVRRLKAAAGATGGATGGAAGRAVGRARRRGAPRKIIDRNLCLSASSITALHRIILTKSAGSYRYLTSSSTCQAWVVGLASSGLCASQQLATTRGGTVAVHGARIAWVLCARGGGGGCCCGGAP